MGFSALEGFEVTEVVTRALGQDGITDPTPVQQATMAPILEGKHVVIESGTGTGKTLAYLLPILQRLATDPAGRVVVFAPSAELAMQTLRVADRYKDPGIATGSLVGSGSHKQQKARVTKSTRLIVGTPGRILEMYAKRKLKGVTTVVLDEPDPILAHKEADFLREVLSRPDPKVQLIIAAATMGPNAERLVQQVMKQDCVRPQVRHSPLHSTITHHLVSIGNKAPKEVRLAQFIQDNRCRRAILFVNQDHLIRHLYRFLDEHNLKPVSLYSERDKQERKKAVAEFGESKARVLITNDGAARGLDVSDVEWVLHYDLPNSPQAYVHRAGRTGRAGKTGRSVVFVSDEQKSLLKRFSKELGIEFSTLDKKRTTRPG